MIERIKSFCKINNNIAKKKKSFKLNYSKHSVNISKKLLKWNIISEFRVSQNFLKNKFSLNKKSIKIKNLNNVFTNNIK